MPNCNLDIHFKILGLCGTNYNLSYGRSFFCPITILVPLLDPTIHKHKIMKERRVKAHYGWTNFHQNRWCIINIIVCSKFKFWWHHLTILYISKKPYNVHNNILELKFHSKSRLISIQRLDEEDWIKSMYTTYIMCSFLLAIGLHVCGS